MVLSYYLMDVKINCAYQQMIDSAITYNGHQYGIKPERNTSHLTSANVQFCVCDLQVSIQDLNATIHLS